MRILVIGGGGREHALVWKFRQSPMVKEIYCAPGNAGIAELASCIDIGVEDINVLLEFALEKKIDLTVVGPEVPLTLGVVDKFQARGLRIFGPSQKAAEIEGSKAFSKELMEKYKIPTAKYQVFTDSKQAFQFIDEIGIPCVVKADGLAAGKGVIICFSKGEAIAAVEEILLKSKFGKAGEKVVIEEYLVGQEVSMLAFTDGKTVIPMVSAQDHKRVFDNDQGPNTGGMGAYSPAPVYTQEIHEIVLKDILEATVLAMAEEGRIFQGILYAGLMLTEAGPKVLEFNARFGDPETQAVLPRLKSDLIDIMEAVVDGELDKASVEWFNEPAVCVVIAAGGYPEEYENGKIISGLKNVPESVLVFHAGTKKEKENILTNGGRVLGVTALGIDIKEAINKAYQGAEQISFEGAQYRKDIGARALV
ncbi:MAG: phosphoribosylamine--glycine ligase [Clostridiaceae bacterium BRH_c20a]|nr:MAG: phosphoribosylamine--glycine ligase [Clostridiaceae bacterium BRH_c20a]